MTDLSIISPELARLLAQIDVGGPDDCWYWMGRTDIHGYGCVDMDGTTARPHRLMLETRIGRRNRAPDGKKSKVYWKCFKHSYDAKQRKEYNATINKKQRACCNPNHLTFASVDVQPRPWGKA